MNFYGKITGVVGLTQLRQKDFNNQCCKPDYTRYVSFLNADKFAAFKDLFTVKSLAPAFA